MIQSQFVTSSFAGNQAVDKVHVMDERHDSNNNI